MKVFFLFVLLIFVGTSVTAQQFSFEFWHEGKLVLESGDTLKGQIKYDLQSDLIQYQLKNHFESYTARKVVFFEIFDALVKNYRQFYSLPFSANGSYKAPVFFELVAEGKLTVLCREHVEYRNTYSPYYYYSYQNTFTKLVLVNKYFTLKDNGDIVEFTGKKNDWLDMMDTKAEEVSKYAKQNRFDFDNKYQLGRIISYYNSFFAPK